MTRAGSFDDNLGRSFEEEWPEFARRLDRFLAAKGVETWLRADLVQETGTRLYQKWPRLDRSRPLWNLVVTIALGVLVDERRMSQRFELMADVPHREVDDVESRALHRVHLVRTGSALNRLSGDQRRVLLAEVGEAAAFEGPRNRINVLRLRARAALRRELGPWAPAGIVLRLRSLGATVERRVLAWSAQAHGLAVSITGIAAAVTLFLPTAGDGRTGASLDDTRVILGSEGMRHAASFRPGVEIPRPKTRELPATGRTDTNPDRLPDDTSAETPDAWDKTHEAWDAGREVWDKGVEAWHRGREVSEDGLP